MDHLSQYKTSTGIEVDLQLSGDQRGRENGMECFIKWQNETLSGD